MWDGWVVPRLVARSLGRPIAVTTLRTTGLGESLLADRLGSLLARDRNPSVATYARNDAVDIRIAAFGDAGAEAVDLLRATEADVLAAIGDHVWGRGSVTFPDAVSDALDARGWRLAVVEVGIRGALLALLGEGLGDRLAFGESLPEMPPSHGGHTADLPHLAARVRELGACEVGLAVRALRHGSDLAASVAIVDPDGEHSERRVVFLDGPLGRTRVAVAAAAILLARLRRDTGS